MPAIIATSGHPAPTRSGGLSAATSRYVVVMANFETPTLPRLRRGLVLDSAAFGLVELH
jgi:hypothetical protein